MIQKVPASQIVPGPNDRKTFDRAGLEELAASIAREGIHQPPKVRPLGDGRFEIIMGERRTRAMKEVLGWGEIPVVVVDMDDERASMAMLIENVNRKDLNPIEEANAYRSRMERFGMDVDDLSKRIGIRPDRIRRRLKLLELAPPVQELVALGQMPLGHAELLGVLDHYRQLIAMRVFRSGKGVTLDMFRKIVSDLREEQDQGALFDLESFWVEQVQKEPEFARGKKARIDVPTRNDLPRMRIQGVGNAAGAMKAYIDDLLAAGREEEAATVGTVLVQLVQGNYMKAPTS